ncbi:MAG TPA: hypothetical protein VD864_13835 [Nocardioides sp.]|nr:hypothetical protein [Nocardioides sp.]
MPSAGDYVYATDVQDVADELADSITSWAAGAVSIVPVANTPTAGAVAFGKTLDSNVRVVATGTSTVPGSNLTEVAQSGTTTTGTNIYIYRTNTTSTSVHWLAIGGAS